MCKGFSHISGVLHHLVLVKLATSSIRVKAGAHMYSDSHGNIMITNQHFKRKNWLKVDILIWSDNLSLSVFQMDWCVTNHNRCICFFSSIHRTALVLFWRKSLDTNSSRRRLFTWQVLVITSAFPIQTYWFDIMYCFSDTMYRFDIIYYFTHSMYCSDTMYRFLNTMHQSLGIIGPPYIDHKQTLKFWIPHECSMYTGFTYLIPSTACSIQCTRI